MRMNKNPKAMAEEVVHLLEHHEERIRKGKEQRNWLKENILAWGIC